MATSSIPRPSVRNSIVCPRVSLPVVAIAALALLSEVAFASQSGSIWQPPLGTSWQYQLSGPVNTSHAVEMYDIDLFDTSPATITELHNAGRVAIAHISVGTYENWRPDAGDFPSGILGNDVDGWFGEKWLDISDLVALAPIMEARLDLAVAKGFDGVEADDIDGYAHNSGFGLTYQDQLDYNIWIAQQAHARGLSVGMKNDLEQTADLVSHFDWALNEECFSYGECDQLLPFATAGKAVFGVEYVENGGDPEVYCPNAVANGFSWLTKTLGLGDEPPNSCDGDGTAAPESELPKVLIQMAPNPFHRSTAVTFGLDSEAHVGVAVYDPTGRLVRTLSDGSRVAGRHNVIWDGHDESGSPVTSGVYFVRLLAGDRLDTRRVVYLR